MEDKMEWSALIEQLSLQSVMVEADDLPGLGEILRLLEEVENQDGVKGHPSLGPLIRGLRRLVERIILNEVSDSQGAIGLLRRGVKWMQSRLLFSERSNGEEEEEFWKSWRSLTGEEAPVEGQGDTSPDKKTAPAPVTLDQDLDLYKDFISESLEHLGTIELNLINLEQSPDNKEYINSIFRPFHTIKGVSGFLNLQEIQKFSHAMESLLDEARNGRLQITQAIIDFILESVDLLKQMILDLRGHIESGQIGTSSFDLDPYLQRIEAFKKGRPICEESKDSGSVEKDVSIPIDEEKTPRLGEILTAKGTVSPEDITEALKAQESQEEPLKLGEILIREKKASPKEVLDALREQKRVVSQFRETSVKVDTDKLDNLVDLIGELVIAQSLVEQNPVFSSLRDQKLLRDFSQLKRITNDLQKISMSLRTVPIRQTFQKMVRLVRDLAKKSKKEVELVMSGEETEIDRNMVESLYDPLVHMIRNAIDHGIESPEERRAKGKPETGTIFLRAYQKGGNVVIEIEDDGQGLNREKILKKARERGIVSDEPLAEHQIDHLIFEPGFSTADQITDISGRGVGMDVVKKSIEQLRGKVEIFSQEGKGTRFIMRVPLTLAIMDGIIVRVGEERYIIPTVFVKETLKPRREEVYSVHQRGELVKVRESLLPLVRLYQILGVATAKQNPWETLLIVAENEGVQKCLMVDDLVGKQEVVIKNLGEKLKDLKGVAGATIMGDGRAGLILDIHGLFQIDQGPSPRNGGGGVALRS
ncbi:MAG: chemotaxis protein CheA [Desulfobacterota bacterium]|nr:chemotaxis protein CheA [Thermodesulfobacteriota bacterium]